MALLQDVAWIDRGVLKASMIHLTTPVDEPPENMTLCNREIGEEPRYGAMAALVAIRRCMQCDRVREKLLKEEL